MKSITTIMKSYYKTLALFVIMAVSLSKVQGQAIWIANNNPGAKGGVNVFTGSGAADSCIAHAVAGDIIHLVPSSISYGNLTLDKSLSLYGIGINPSKEGNRKSIVDYVYVHANNCVVSGLNVNSYVTIGASGSPTSMSGLLIEYCTITYGIQLYSGSYSVGNLTIHNNIFNGNGTAYRIYLNYTKSSGVSITNNIFMVDNSGYGGILVDGGASITNNIFVSNGGSSSWAFYQIDGNVIKNNVFFGTQPFGRTSTTNNTFTNNMTYGAVSNTIPIGSNGNVGDTTLANLNPKFVNVPLTVLQWNNSYDPNPQVGVSPMIGAGDDGLDVGVTGGAIPFNFNGTNLPLITSVNIPSVIIQGNTLPATIKAKGN